MSLIQRKYRPPLTEKQRLKIVQYGFEAGAALILFAMYMDLFR